MPINIWDVNVPESLLALYPREIEEITLTAGQLVVVFTNVTDNATFYINGPLVDSTRLRPTTDYTVVDLTKTLTLAESYPAGTVITMTYVN